MFPADLHPTRRKILAAAEPLFAQAGVAAVSLRQITVAARVNLAAVNYHFYDKSFLYKELLVLRLRQVGRQRLALLTGRETPAADTRTALREIFQALAAPMFLPDEQLGPHAPRLISRLLLEPQEGLERLVQEEFEPVLARFGRAIRKHSLHLEPADHLWRFSHTVGALHHAVLILPAMGVLTRGICRPEHAEQSLANYVGVAAEAFTDQRSSS